MAALKRHDVLPSLLCLVATGLSVRPLSEYVLHRGVASAWSALEIAWASPGRYWLVFWVAVTTTSAIWSSLILANLLTRTSEVGSTPTVGLYAWAGIMGLNALCSFYLLLFFLLLVLLALGLALGFLAGGAGRGGGSVHVRGHYRRGSYVRSHTRRPPRRY